MIETLRIENFAIVDSAELEFAAGLNVLTGETGAGKSIVLGALSLLAGGRATTDAIRDGAERAEAEAVFSTQGLPERPRTDQVLRISRRLLQPEIQPARVTLSVKILEGYWESERIPGA